MNTGFYLFPPSASAAAGRYDALFLALVLLTGFAALAVTLLIVYFSIRYRKGSRADRVDRVAQEFAGTPAVMTIVDFIRKSGEHPLCLPRARSQAARRVDEDA